MHAQLYQIITKAVLALLPLAGAVNSKLRKGLQGREGWRGRLQALRAKSAQPLAWFHCASLGEFEQGRPLIEAYKAAHPDHLILLTFFSPSGYEIRKDYAVADHVDYLPFDSQRNAADFVALVQPRLAFFIKYEFWYNYLRALRQAGVRTLSVSTILRPGQALFTWYGFLQRKSLHFFDYFFVQNKETKRLLEQLGITQVSIAGDTRFDRVLQIAEAAAPNAIAAAFCAGAPTLIAGSTWAEDLAVLLPAWEKTPTLKLIIAPHEIHEEEIAELVQRYEGIALRYTEASPEQDLSHYRVLVVDTIGQLSQLYRYAQIAYIGGAFGKGLHNILEAATFGMPIYFGNKAYHKFAEANVLIAQQAAHPIAHAQELQHSLRELQADPAALEQQSQTTRSYVSEQAGATPMVIKEVNRWLLAKEK